MFIAGAGEGEGEDGAKTRTRSRGKGKVAGRHSGWAASPALEGAGDG
jgi:hypothetical protein